MKPLAPDLRSQAVAWLRASWDDWNECRGDPHYAPEHARSLLAAWGTLARLADPLPSEVAEVPALVPSEAEAILAAMSNAPAPAEWLERAEELTVAWDFADEEDSLRELTLAAGDLFARLDRHGLALCMARRVAGKNEPQWLAEWKEQLVQAENYFSEHVGAFLPAAPLASAVFAASRPDLDETDPELWETLLKHGRLEECWEEEQAVRLPALTEADKQAIRDHMQERPAIVSFRQGLAFSRTVLRDKGLAAAKSGEKRRPASRRLRWYSPDGKHEASLILPKGEAGGNETARLTFYEVAGGDAAQEFANTAVSLAGIERQLDGRARADFTEVQLDDARQDLSLEVAGELWKPVQQP